MATKIEMVNSFLSAGEEPVKSYIKTILGKVAVIFWDNYENKPASVILAGDPRKKEENTVIDVFSDREDAYFRKSNRKLFQLGLLIPYERKTETKREKTLEEFSDEELTVIVNKPFLALQNALNKATTEAVVSRMLNIASDLEKSEKVIRAIESRLSEIQAENQPDMPKVMEEEL
jgi:hypothetical protein